jgi:dihydropteroate synthase
LQIKKLKIYSQGLAMKLYKIDASKNQKELLKQLNVDSGGIAIISDKMNIMTFLIRDLRTPAANILKQDALSIGAEVATPRGTITCETQFCDVLLIVTPAQLKKIIKKELAQPFGLKAVAQELQKFNKTNKFEPKIMGIINANSDSFYDKSRFNSANAISEIEKMIEDGADIIDIGAVSSRPNAPIVSSDEEMERIKDICDAIKEQKLYEKAIFSIDSYTPSVVEYALISGFKIINDITGASDNEIIKLAIKYSSKLCIMHMQGTPQTMQQTPHYEDVMSEVSDFFEERITKCEALGLGKENIIIDVGIGFGKSLEHNLALIKNLSHFEKFGCEILMGASRKSMIDKIIKTPIEDRLSGTLAIHLKALENGANIIRCHDVSEHKQAISVWQEIQGA